MAPSFLERLEMLRIVVPTGGLIFWWWIILSTRTNQWVHIRLSDSQEQLYIMLAYIQCLSWMWFPTVLFQLHVMSLAALIPLVLWVYLFLWSWILFWSISGFHPPVTSSSVLSSSLTLELPLAWPLAFSQFAQYKYIKLKTLYTRHILTCYKTDKRNASS